MISFILAMSKNRVIGKDNSMPWHLPADLAHFKRTTSGHTIVMGRKTFQSIGKPLPKRKNVILTRNQDFTARGCEVLHSREEVLALAEQEKEIFLIGGTELFKLFWEDVERIYLTYIDAEFEGDTFFPELDDSQWQLKAVEEGNVDEKNSYAHQFRLYERTKR